MVLRGGKARVCVQVAACVLLGGAPLLASDKPTTLTIKQGAPEGFEQMAEPQETQVDVSYGGVKIGSFRAVYTPKTISFADPSDLVAKIPAIKHEDVDRVVKALTGDLPTQASLICGHFAKKDCGTLTPDVAGVIFYEDGFRAELFVNPSMLASQDTHTDKILPPAPDIFSAVHQFNGSFTGSPGEEQNYSLLANSTVAYGPERLNMVGIASNQQKQINTFTASLDKWGLDNEAGFFNSRPLQLLPQIAMSGVSVGTSLKTNLALRDAAGSTLSVFLPQRSYVSLVYNNVIYSTDLYEAGNQVLNTNALPQGAYEVTIRVRDLAGNQTEEKRFFAKNFAIPPKDQPIYFGQAGTVRNTTNAGVLTGFGSTPIVNGGMIKRIGENSAIDTDFLVVKDTFFTEAGAFLLLPPNHQFQASTLLSSHGDTGFGASYIGYMLDQKLSMSGNARVIFARDNHLEDDTQPDLVEPIQGSTRQLTSTIAYQLTPKANIGLDANYTQTDNEGLQYAYGPELRYDFWREGPNSLMLTANADNTQNGLQETAFLTLNIRLGAWGFTGQGEYNKEATALAGGQSATESGDARVTWNDDKDPSHLTIIGAETRHDNDSNSYITDFNHQGTSGNLKLSASQTDGSSGNNTFYTGSFGFSIANTAHEVAWGGNQQDNSGFILKNTGDSVDVPMKVLIDNSEKSKFSTGESTALFLSPYQTYRVSIKPVQSSSIDYDGSVKSITLYPGNIVPLVWDINRISVVVGHVVLPDGTPLSDARLEEARNITVTDSDGLFQGELLVLKTITFKRAAEKPAFITTPDVDIFSALPPKRHYRDQPSSMTIEAQRKAILELFGAQDDLIPNNKIVGPPLPPLKPLQGPPPPEPEATPVEPAHKLRPALRCRVTLPEVKEASGVFVYPDNLVCMPIPFEPSDVYGPSQSSAPAGKAPATKTSSQVLWEAFAPPASPQEYSLATDIFVNAAKLLPRPDTRMPQELMPNFFAAKIAPGIPEGGPFIPSALPVWPDTDETPDVPVGPPSPNSIILPEKLQTPMSPGAFIGPVKLPAPQAAAPLSGLVEVQVGSYRSEASAQEAYEQLGEKYKEVAGKTYSIVRVDLGTKGIYYRLHIGNFASTSEATLFCATLSAKGQDCFMLPRKAKK